MLINLFIASGFVLISIALILNFEFLFRTFENGAKQIKHFKSLIETLVRAYVRFRRMSEKPYLIS